MYYPPSIGFVGEGEPRYIVTLTIYDRYAGAASESSFSTWDRDDLPDAVKAASRGSGVYI